MELSDFRFSNRFKEIAFDSDRIEDDYALISLIDGLSRLLPIVDVFLSNHAALYAHLILKIRNLFPYIYGYPFIAIIISP